MKNKQKGYSSIIVLFALLSLGALLFFGYKTYKSNPSNDAQEYKTEPIEEKQISKVIVDDSDDFPEPDSENWTIHKLTPCNTQFYVPPKKSPYLNTEDGRYWQYQFNGTAELDFEYSARVIHRNELDASGFVPGLISVSCGSNLNNYTTETLATTYENYSNEFGSTKTSESVERHWGLDTIKQTYSGGQQPEEVYLFVSGDTFYKVTNIVMSDVDSVKSASEEILSKLNIAEQQY